MQKLVMAEVGALQRLDHHPNIVKLLDFGHDTYKKTSGVTRENQNYLVLELGEGGELFDFIALTGAFSEDVARYFFK